MEPRQGQGVYGSGFRRFHDPIHPIAIDIRVISIYQNRQYVIEQSLVIAFRSGYRIWASKTHIIQVRPPKKFDVEALKSNFEVAH